jgi:hypothetical protein
MACRQSRQADGAGVHITSELKETFEHQAAWRWEKGAEHPEDKRNLEAADNFDRLAATAAEVPQEVLTAAEELFDDLRDTEVEQEMLRAVGFHAWPKNEQEFVRDFIAKSTGQNRRTGALRVPRGWGWFASRPRFMWHAGIGRGSNGQSDNTHGYRV